MRLILAAGLLVVPTVPVPLSFKRLERSVTASGSAPARRRRIRGKRLTRFSYADPTMPRLQRGLVQAIERMTGRPKLERLYRDYVEAGAGREDFFSGAVRRLALNVRFDAAKLSQLPETGPVVVVANHPYGVLDGIVLGWLVGQVRQDFLILVHSLLTRAPEARPYLLPVDFSGTEEAQETNLRSRERARQHLSNGGVLIVFPAGAVSTSPDALGRSPAVDAPWHPFVAQLVLRQKTPVLPVHFAGQNSRLFQIASHVSMTLRLSLIFKEVHDRIGTDVDVAVGDLVPFEELRATSGRNGLLAHLRRLTYALSPEGCEPAARSPHAGLAELKAKLARLKSRQRRSRARAS
jgi:putative hemolysin